MEKHLKVFRGPIVHSNTEKRLEILENGLLIVLNGKVDAITDSKDYEDLKKKYGFSYLAVKNISKGEFLMPGLIDTHAHAPQFPNIGLGYDKPLLEWLDAYTFPTETTYSDSDFANKIYKKVVKTTLKCGTTTACYFATIHTESSVNLAKICLNYGQRAFVGKVNMNVNHPETYGESTQDSIENTKIFIKAVRDLKDSLVQPIITPRFAITCSDELMEKLGKIAEEYDVHIQTHISEAKGEICAVKEIFPNSKNYADVYNKAKLLTKKTILAHAVHLTDDEVNIIKEKECGIAHCANSNIRLLSGHCDVQRLLKAGVKVGLGTDFSGGSGFSIIEAMRDTLSVSNSVSFSKPDGSYVPLNYEDAFYLGTLGGAQALAIDSTVGNFDVGKEFDGLIINMDCGASKLVKEYSIRELVQKFIYTGDDRNVKKVYVRGKNIV